jgi:hypothetical protein
MGFNRRKMEDARRAEAEKEAAARRATGRQIQEDAEHLLAASTDTTMDKIIRRGIDLVLAEHKANRS